MPSSRADATSDRARLETLRAEKPPPDLAGAALFHWSHQWRNAADGREVDLAALRGKVVLIDFWATWCKPCIAEIPHIKDVYARYHSHGFEVIGITLENSGVQPGDASAAAQAKLASAKQKLLDFVTTNETPWPQYFDGLGWRNAYAVKYGIRGIPAMFLLDQTGRVVTMDARGDKLEREVKRLLKR